MQGQSNRRSFLRHDDEILLSLRKLDDGATKRIVASLARWRLDFSPANKLLPGRQHMMTKFRQIQDHSPDVAAYLAHLERRLDALAGEAANRPPEKEIPKPVPVNLSAQGLRCESKETLSEDDMVEVAIVLIPDHEEVAAVGRIIRVVPGEKDGVATVSVNFDYIRDADQDVLIRHVNRLQRDQLAQRRKSA